MSRTLPRLLSLAPLALVMIAACRDAVTAPPGGPAVPNATSPDLTPGGGSALLTTGTVRLGLRREGTLGAGIVDPRSPYGNVSEFLGLRYVPTNAEGVFYYDQWAVADAAAPAYTDRSRASATLERFASGDAGTATVTFLGQPSDAGKQLRVTHAYAASPVTPNLFAVRVTIENAGSTPIGELRYARSFLWLITPRGGAVAVTSQGTAASPYVIGASNDLRVDPIGPLTSGVGRVTGDFVDAPAAPGFDNATNLFLRFGALGVGERVEFTTFLGAAGNEADALAAVAAVGADVYQLAQADAGQPDAGAPNTFIYGFSSASVRGARGEAMGTALLDGNSGRCLDVLGESREPGAGLTIYDCHGRANQRFTYPAAGETGEIRVYAGEGTPLCVDAWGAGTENGTRLVVWPCHGGANQQWTRTAAGEFRGVQSGRCVDVLGARTENLTDVWLWDCLDAPNQRWDAAPPEVVAAR